jgi:hypothetical protein
MGIASGLLSGAAGGGGGETTVEGWVRPADWPAMPADAANKVCILAAVFDTTANYVAVHCSVSSGTYDVDWGDGDTSTGVTSNTVASHQYSFADVDLGALTSRGYKTAMIVVTPNTGGANFTNVDFGRKNATSGLQDAPQPWLDIQINAPSATSLTMRNAMIPRLCERIKINAVGAITGFNVQAFDSLQQVDFPVGSLQSLTSINFQQCRSLRKLEFPAGSLAALTGLQSAFRDMSSLQRLEFPSGALPSITTLEACFSGDQSLREVVFPSGALASCTTIREAFQNCSALQQVTLPDLGTLGATGLQNTFNGCSSITKITFPTGKMGSLTTLSTPFGNCLNLREIENCEIPVTFALTNCMLDAANLDQVYTSLPAVVGQTITVTGNIGISGDDPTIATGKGWTVTGS